MSALHRPSWLTAIRYSGNGQGHYESFYLKANHPSRRLGIWLKYNLLAPKGASQDLQGELWGVWFDGEKRQQVVAQQIVPRSDVAAPHGATTLRLGDAAIAVGGEQLTAQAQVQDTAHTIAWDVQLIPAPEASGSTPVVHYPHRWLYERPFPKKKVCTPIPRGSLRGWITVDGERHSLDGWDGLHGHNWGSEHAYRYAYGNGLFPDGAFFDGFTARIAVGPLRSPWVSLLVVRLPDGRELPFNQPIRWLSGAPSVGTQHWTVDLPGAHDTRARITVETSLADMVGLRYRYPDGRIGCCLNTKFAQGTLRVEQRGHVLYDGVSERCELETFGPTPPSGVAFHGTEE